MSNRGMVELIHAEGFFPPGEAEKYAMTVGGLQFQPRQYGLEIDNFNMILSGIEPVLSKVLGERVIVDSKRSGIFRKPLNNVIHFEEFDSLNEWCFIVALERTTLNLYHHIGPDGQINAKNALHGWQFNYMNMFEWNLHTNVLLEPNQGVFIRPWMFHSLDQGMVQYYRLITDRKFRVLVMGMPGSERPDVAKKLHEVIPNSKLMRSKEIREKEKDIDFSYDGRMRHAYRMLDFARQSTEDCIIIDMVCPLEEMRQIINPDVIIWINDKTECMYEEVNNSFEPPKLYDLKYNKITEETIGDIVEKINSKRV